jgi:hypothetical protein
MVLHPCHQAACFDFFTASHETERMQFDGPRSTISALEQAAAQAGRTWNGQLTYVLGLFLGDHPPDFDDGRTVADWRTLLSPCAFRFSESEGWTPCTCLWRKAP